MKKVFVLMKIHKDGRKEPVGYYDSLPEAICAFEEERKKEDGVRLQIRQEEITV